VSGAIQKRTFGVSVSDVTAIDCWVEDVTAELGVSEQTAFRARVCIAELATNVLEHGFFPAANDQITISIAATNGGIKIEFTDTRGPFDPTTRPIAWSFGDRANGGGRGLVLLHAYAKKMKYSNDGSCNRVNFEVPLGPAEMATA
jgi:anti-sigma regulatory factor (Ser/Thr protein kinase)